MKESLLALTLLTAPGLMAQDVAPVASSQAECCSNCCCTPCCCVPKPQKCIDCECYVPPFYDLQCAWGFSFDVEFLYWYAREDNLPYAVETLTQSEATSETNFLVAPTSVKRLDGHWDPGVRAGLGWNSCCDGWDVYLNWTYYKNTSSEKNSLEANQNFVPFDIGDRALMHGYISQTIDKLPYFSSMSAKWTNRFNQIDLEVGKKYWLSRCFNMRPFAGLRGAWTRTTFNVRGTSGPSGSDNAVEISDVTFKNRIWGVGIEAGLEPTWYLSSCFAVYGEFGLSAIWGRFRSTREDLNSFESDVDALELATLSLSDSFYKMSGMLDFGLGLRWETTWCCDRFRTALDLGWEHHYWIGHSEYYKEYSITETSGETSGDYATRYGMDRTDLGYGGLIVRLRFDF